MTMGDRCAGHDADHRTKSNRTKSNRTDSNRTNDVQTNDVRTSDDSITGPIPSSPGELTVEFVGRAMAAAGVALDRRPTSLRWEPLAGGGVSHLGQVVRVHLAGLGPTGPGNLIAKFPTPDRRTRGLVESFDPFAREIRFYRTLAHRQPISVPRFLGGAYDDLGSARRSANRLESVLDRFPSSLQLAITRYPSIVARPSRRRSVLLVADVGPGAVVRTMVDPPTTGELRRILRSVARLHAHWWGRRPLAPEDLDRAVVATHPRLYQAIARRRGIPLAEATLRPSVTFGDLRTMWEAIDRFPSDLALVNEPVTLLHGDLRPDNVIFAPDTTTPTFLDWSFAALGHPMFDVAYLLSSSIEPDGVADVRHLAMAYMGELGDRGVVVAPLAGLDALAAALRVLIVQQLLALVHLPRAVGDAPLAEVWLPRLVAAHRALGVRTDDQKKIDR